MSLTIHAHPSRRGQRYLDRARAYECAAVTLAYAGVVEHARPPFFMLVAHAMELGLKAVIGSGHVDDERLMLLGHDLLLCLELARDDGLDLDPNSDDVEAVIAALAKPHLAQTLRYPAYLSWPLPDSIVALDTLARLLSRVKAFIDEAAPKPGGDAGLRARG